MKLTAFRLKRWGRRLGLEPLDLWFLGLRAVVLAGGLAWWRLESDWTRAPQAPILGMFLVFSVGVYALNALHPGRIALLYRVALVFDLLVVVFLVRITGGFASDVRLAFVLLIAVHAYYFGLGTGIATAAAASALYALAGDWPPPMPGFGVRIAFFWLAGVSLGLLSEQVRKQREELEQQHEQLIRSDRLATVGELAAGLAHELRNPLAGISGALHVLGTELASRGELHGLLADVEAQITRMNRTLTELLQHAKPAEPQHVAVDVNAVLEETLRFTPRGSIEVLQLFDKSLPTVHGDPHLLRQAFLNMLVNARQAMPHGGRLTVRTRSHQSARSALEVLISDTGVGIAPEHVSRIFQPFFTTKAQGTGLGLAIAARVVEQHGGRITVESVPGQGTTFTIVLPAGPAPEPVRSHEYAIQSADH